MRNMKRFYLTVVVIFYFFINTSQVLAESTYVLPYPSSMPGNIFYRLNTIQEEIFKFWYFGDFGQYKYNQTLADKYLVEAKTLFEYKQYLLGVRALKKSDQYYEKIMPSIQRAKKNNKNVSKLLINYVSASQKHIEELNKMKLSLPETFSWRPEKDTATELNLWRDIEKAKAIRKR